MALEVPYIVGFSTEREKLYCGMQIYKQKGRNLQIRRERKSKHFLWAIIRGTRQMSDLFTFCIWLYKCSVWDHWFLQNFIWFIRLLSCEWRLIELNSKDSGSSLGFLWKFAQWQNFHFLSPFRHSDGWSETLSSCNVGGTLHRHYGFLTN